MATTSWTFLKGLLLAWFDIQRAEFPHLVKKWRREKIPCGKKWDETAPVCSSYYGTHINTDDYGKWMRALMVERGVARAMDSFVKGALGGKAPEERSLETFREIVASTKPDEWPDWVRDLADLASEMIIRTAS